MCTTTAMPTTTPLRGNLGDLGKAVQCTVVNFLQSSVPHPNDDGNGAHFDEDPVMMEEEEDHDDEDRPPHQQGGEEGDGHRQESSSSSTMNVEKHSQTVAPSIGFSGDMLGRMLPALITRGKFALSSLPQQTLEQNLEPIIHSLERLNAELLLDLQPAKSGPRVAEGQYVNSIYNEVLPAIGEAAPDQSCVRYLHISEIPDQYSIGIFVFAPYARIPLHDHPDMCVLSRILYGDLQRLSLDLAREDPDDDHIMSLDDSGSSIGMRKSASEWLGGWLHHKSSTSPSCLKLPEGSKRAFKNHVDHLQAPDVTVLYPYEGNLHEFVAGPNGAAVLDVLLPPYDHCQNRDCTFYTIHDMPPDATSFCGKDPCYIVPTGQPENFHCISGQYRDLGAVDDWDT